MGSQKPLGRILKTGKLDTEVLRTILARFPVEDPRVILGPKIGEDAAVVDPSDKGDHYWVVTSDPITFTTEEMGYYGVVVNLNDIATRGAIPRWFLATLLFPEGESDTHLVERVFLQVGDACRRFGITLIGGHTEITPGISRPILSGHMIGEVPKGKLVTTGGAREGDLLLLVKGVCIEGTSILARERERELLAKGIAPSLVQRARMFIFEPGIEVLRPARIAMEAAAIHSMHDPTEGGVINGIVEMAIASEKEIEVELSRIFVYRESRILCREFGLDPLGVIASGALLLTIAPEALPSLRAAFAGAAIPLEVIGNVRKGPPRVIARDEKERREVLPFSRDEILKLYDEEAPADNGPGPSLISS